MHRIDTATAQKDKFGVGKNGFTSGNPQTGVPATEVSADILDAVQEEVCAVIAMAGMQLNKSDNSQLASAIQAIAFGAFPVGAPIPWPLAVPPAGFLLMTGQVFNTMTYPRLAQAYPSGVLPDLRGEFIRGWDNGRGVDANRKVLSWQSGTHITGDNSSSPAVHGIADLSTVNADPGDGVVRNIFYVPAASTESNLIFWGMTRPRNVAFNYIVRAS